MKRHGGIAIAVLAVALGVALWMNLRPDAATLPFDAETPPVPAGAVALAVLFVYDGDTIRARAPTTSDVVATTEPFRIRIIGIDTPEAAPVPQCGADAARDHLRALLPEGTTVWAAADRETEDDYGRRLLHLWTADGRFVPAELVRAGDAEAIRIWPNVTHVDLLSSLQREAQAAGRGRWGTCD